MTASRFPQQKLFGIRFDALSLRDAVDWVLTQVAVGPIDGTRYVVTPNISLTLRHQRCENFRRIIHDADLTIVDGAPVVRASKWFRKPLPERVAGSDLVFALFDAAIEECPLRVFLLGAAPGVGERAAERIHRQWKGVNVVGTFSPDFGFEKDKEVNEAIVDRINSARPDVLVVGLGAPKQETWAWQHRTALNVAVTLCVGGTIDFLAGQQYRAPAWIRHSGIEWCWRLITNPRRLAKRYFKDAARLPALFWNEFRGRCPEYQQPPDTGSAVIRTADRTGAASPGAVPRTVEELS